MSKNDKSQPGLPGRGGDRRTGADRRVNDRSFPADTVTVAELLLGARQKKGQSLEEASTATHIRVRQLEALESGQYDQLQNPLFAKGYLQIYGDFLELDSEALLQQYEAEMGMCRRAGDTGVQGKRGLFGLGAAQGSLTDRQRAVDRLDSGRTPGAGNWSFGVLSTMPFLLVILLAWSYQIIDLGVDTRTGLSSSLANAPESLGPLATIAVSTDVGKDVNVTDAPESDSEAGLPIALVIDSSGVATANYLSGGGTGDIESEGESANQSQIAQSDDFQDGSEERRIASSLPSLQPSSFSAYTGTSSERAPERSAISGVRASAAAMIAQHQPSDRLVIKVAEDSWVDIRDGAGNRLYRDLARAGNRIDVSGSLPFSLHVGNAPGLVLELNGSPFEIETYRPDNSARLTIAMQ